MLLLVALLNCNEIVILRGDLTEMSQDCSNKEVGIQKVCVSHRRIEMVWLGVE